MARFTAPPRPSIALRVGVTGHRPGDQLPQAGIASITAEVTSILARLTEAVGSARAANATVFAEAAPALRLVSALAEGADRIAAKAALAAGWSLEVVLPLTRETYEADFVTQASRQEFGALLARASSVFCLAMPADEARRTRAYEAAGHLTLDNCDMLLAIWDGKQARGQGGTAEVVQDALERGIPVLRVDAMCSAPTALLIGERAGVELKQDLTGLVARMLAPPPDKKPPTQSPDGAPSDRKSLMLYLNENAWNGAARDGRILGWWRFTRLFFGFARMFGASHTAGHAGHDTRQAVGADRNPPEPGGLMLAARYEAADAVSTHLGHVYRSAFVLVFLASAFAVLAGLAGIFWWKDAVVKAGFVGVELLFIGVLLLLTYTGRTRQWHRRWLETRRLAELLRVTAALTPAGGGPPIAPSSSADGDGGWTEWYARASLRETHLPNRTADADWLGRMTDGFVADIVDDQIDYHNANAKRLHALHLGLDRIGMTLFFATLAIGLCFVAVVIAGKGLHLIDLEHGPLHDIFDAWIKPAVTLCSAGLPALGAALYGIRAQGDYESSVSRSETTEKALLALRIRIIAARAHPDIVQLRGLFAEAAEIMQSDLSDWRQIYRHRPLAIPA